MIAVEQQSHIANKIRVAVRMRPPLRFEIDNGNRFDKI